MMHTLYLYRLASSVKSLSTTGGSRTKPLILQARPPARPPAERDVRYRRCEEVGGCVQNERGEKRGEQGYGKQAKERQRTWEAAARKKQWGHTSTQKQQH